MKKKNAKNLIFAVITVVITNLMLGCQTSIPVSYTEPARINMDGISKIGLISNDSSTASTVTTALTNTGKYTVVDGEPELVKKRNWQDEKDYYGRAIEIKADDLVNAYTSNVMRANSNYEKKILIVQGTVTEIQEKAIRLGVGNNSVDVYIIDSEIQKAASLEKGTTVTIIGECYGLKAPDLKDTGEILRILGAGQHVNIAKARFYAPPGEFIASIDAILELKVSSSVNDESKKENRAVKNSAGETLKDANGKTVYEDVTVYRRVANVTVGYEIVNLSGTVIGSGEKSDSSSTSYYENRNELENPAKLIASAKKKPLQSIINDMIPTPRTVLVKLEKSDSKDKEVKSAMSAAKKLVGEKDYVAAAQSYGKIYAQSKDFAAGYNQAIITEITKNTDEAIVLMQALTKSTQNPKAQSMLTEMKSRSAKNKRSAEQLKK